MVIHGDFLVIYDRFMISNWMRKCCYRLTNTACLETRTVQRKIIELIPYIRVYIKLNRQPETML